ncbi:hypothetical protein ACF0H5_000642 [Mactra antiquata]
MADLRIVLLSVVILFAVNSQAMLEIQKHFEFEDVLGDLQDNMWVWRSEASDLKTLRLEDETGVYTVNLNICVQPYNSTMNITLYIDDIRYSNDGPSDTVIVDFDGINIANFTTIEKWRSGHEWNVFRNSGNVGPALNLLPGQYVLQISVLTDQWGVELDRIRVNLENQDPMENVFCGASLSST